MYPRNQSPKRLPLGPTDTIISSLSSIRDYCPCTAYREFGPNPKQALCLAQLPTPGLRVQSINDSTRSASSSSAGRGCVGL